MSDTGQIDLAELLLTLWRGKILIFIVSIGFCIAAGVYIHFSPKSIKAELPLLPLADQQMINYQTYNAVAQEPISSESLFSAFISSLKYKDVVYRAARSIDLFSEAEFENSADEDLAYHDFANRVVLLEAEPEKQIFFKRLVFNVENKDDAYNFAVALTKVANDYIQDVLNEKINAQIDGALQSRQFQIRDLKNEADKLTEDYQDNIDQRLAFLNEQSKIAKSLGLANPALNSTDFSEVVSVVTTPDGSSPFYLRGHTAIDKEIELIKSRYDEAMYIPQLKEINAKIRRLEDVTALERHRELWRLLPLNGTKFAATSTVSNNMVFVNNNPGAFLILALAFITGALLGTIAVLFRNAVSKYQISVVDSKTAKDDISELISLGRYVKQTDDLVLSK